MTTDHFEQAKDKILREARANGGVTSDHLLDAIIATNDDLDEKFDVITGIVAAHIEQAVERDRRITDLELVNEDRRKNCIPEVKRLIQQEHEITHTNYIASLAKDKRDPDDPADSQFLEHRESASPDARSLSQMVMGWTLLKKGLAIAITAAIIGLVGLGITYVGSLWAADRAEQNFVHAEQTMLPTPTVTVTVTPSP